MAQENNEFSKLVEHVCVILAILILPLPGAALLTSRGVTRDEHLLVRVSRLILVLFLCM